MTIVTLDQDWDRKLDALAKRLQQERNISLEEARKDEASKFSTPSR
jgi:predicted transcriptional regulator